MCYSSIALYSEKCSPHTHNASLLLPAYHLRPKTGPGRIEFRHFTTNEFPLLETAQLHRLSPPQFILPYPNAILLRKPERGNCPLVYFYMQGLDQKFSSHQVPPYDKDELTQALSLL